MSRFYYYFGASLPYLKFDSEPLMTVAEFLEDCDRLMEQKDSALIREALSASYEAGSTFKSGCSKAVAVFEISLRNEWASFRAERHRKDANSYLRGSRDPRPEAAEAVSAASKAEDPLAGEKIIDELRWNFLENVVQGHFYDLEYILVYGLKLKILERHQEFKTEKGAEIFEQIKKIEIPDL